MKRIVTIVLAIVIICSSLSICLPVTVSAESLYIRKIVSVVYDDSGSMTGDKWAYANYAMQTFCGMLNSEDQLFITYMRYAKDNMYDPEKIDLSAECIQESVNSIRNHNDSGKTPYIAVEKAYNKLKSINDSNPNTQYWLVVITDGAFDECNSMSKEKKKDFLNEHFKDYAESVMPNGTNPQITFLGIGDVVPPDEDQNKGIFTYAASNALGIISAMSNMADKISGRTRLQKDDIKKIDDKTIQVSSSIPLLNIVAFVQGSQAKVTDAVYSNEMNIPISRNVSLSYPKYSDLVGGAFLIGDSKNVIDSGTYNITFDQNVDLSNVIILFEPALEMRMAVTVNGNKISDYRELDTLMENDKVSVLCKIYEMGTDKEVDPSRMPPKTTFEISILENGKVVNQTTEKDMTLSDYTLKNIDTEINAAVTIQGFNPIAYSVKFTPTKYVHKTVYSISSDYGSSVKSVKFDNISTNKDLSICFTVYADGSAMTDPDAVRALNPTISVLPKGNDGIISYSNDGKIVFTPNVASMSSTVEGSFDVEVTCALSDGTTAKAKYTVLIAEYRVIPVNTKDTIKKTEFFGNQVSASFYITKDGVKLDKTAVENKITVLLNEQHSELKTSVSVADDGTITITPYAEEEHKLTFLNWWINWACYFGLKSDDVVVTLNHAFGAADSTIDVVEEGFAYQLFNVYTPLIIELALIIFLAIWITLIITKPRYANGATLFVGNIRYNQETGTHIIRNFTAVRLEIFNRVKKGNGRLKFKRTADVVSANGIRIQADRGGRIICAMPFPWYRGRIAPRDTDLVNNLRTPAEISDYIERHRALEIREFATTETVESNLQRGLTPANPNPRMAQYTVIPDSGARGVADVDGRRVIKSGRLFIYINQ